jgi:DNA-binding NtrC family response regulator/tetratricopeptide (TPR) repeat protein
MDPLGALIGESPAIAAVREQVRRLLQHQSDARRIPSILIQGETGTGKGLLARMIHSAGPRATGPFVDVNCAAIPATLLEAELFGFERGAFTDARHAKLGLFQVAHRGTIFLDEVGLLPDGLQAKLLNVIEERAVRRLGATRGEPVDVAVVAAANEDLAAATRARRFREDLYHRLAVVTLRLPPLRERGPDIVHLAEHFLATACRDYGLPARALAADARAALVAYSWPGNVRELANGMERVALLSEALTVTAAVLGLPSTSPAEPAEHAGSEIERSLLRAVRSVEREQLLAVLRETDWNITRAAVRLRIPRNTLRYRIKKYGLHPRESPPGAAVHAAAPLVVAAPLVPGGPGGIRWERRLVTLLQAALVAPSLADFLADTSRLAVLIEKIRSFRGRLAALSPGGVLAEFGVQPIEDAPSRAAHSALAIQKAMQRAEGGDGECAAVKIGIHAGAFLVGQFSGAAEIDWTARREAAVVLEALVDRADLNTVLVSEAAAAFLERRFELVPVAESTGVPGRVFRLAGRHRTGFGLGGRVTTFVGRREELEVLQSRLVAASEGRGQVVGILGDSGIGKSRLLFEFRQSLGGERVTYLEGNCLSYGRTIPYHPLLDILRQSYAITEGDTPEAIAEKVRAGLKALGMDPDRDAPYLLQLLGLKEGVTRLAHLSPEAIKARTFEILREISLKGSRRRPILLAVEDLHWIDETSDAFLASLVASLPGASILLVVTYRPGYAPSWLGKSYATQIALQPLARGGSLSVVQSVLQTEEVPEPLARLILGKAEGNPFFLEELARALGKQGALGPTLAIPDTVQDVLSARVDRLPEGPKGLLQAASVLGREVSVRLLRALWDGPLEPHLRELARLEFLCEQGGEELVYAFKHALTQEAAYLSLPTPRLQALHAAAGQALEALYADRREEVYDRLAFHYSKTDKTDKAVEYLTHFAEKAARSYALAEAVTALQEALGHVDRLPSNRERERLHLDLILRQANDLYLLGRFQEILDLLLPQQERLERLEDALLAGRYHFTLGRTYSYLADRERATRSAQRAIEAASRSRDDATLGKAYYVLAREESWSGQPPEGVKYGRRAVVLLAGTEERWWLGMAHWIAGINHALMGEFEPALDAEAQAQAVATAIADPRLQTYAAFATGWIHTMRGEWEAAIAACQQALERSPLPLSTARALGYLGLAYLEQGDPSQAIPLLEGSVRELGQQRFRQLEGWFTTLLGDANLLTGDVARAQELATRGLEITSDVGYRYGVGWTQRTLGRIARARGAGSEAETRLREALDTFAGMQARFEVGRTHLELAALAVGGRPPAVTAHLDEAYRLFRTLRVPRYVERAIQLATAYGVSLPSS